MESVHRQGAVGLTSYESDHGTRIGMVKRWAGLAMTIGSRLAALPRTLAQMPKEVWDKLATRWPKPPCAATRPIPGRAGLNGQIDHS